MGIGEADLEISMSDGIDFAIVLLLEEL